jgi:hypothetical protein
LELLRSRAEAVVPSQRTVNRILARQGLLVERPRKRSRDSYRRWERPGPRQLWGIDIVGGVMIVNPVTGEVREAKVVTGSTTTPGLCARGGGGASHWSGGVSGVCPAARPRSRTN